MTHTEYNKIKETLQAYIETIEILETLEKNGGEKTTKQEFINTLNIDLK